MNSVVLETITLPHPKGTRLYSVLAATPADLRVQPKMPMPATQPGHDPSLSTDLPPLLKGYLRLGAWICGEACWDPDFRVADVLILVDVHNVPLRYRRHFLREWEIQA